MLSAVQKAKRIYVREYPEKNEAFISGLKRIVPQLGVELRIIPGGTYDPHNIWLQDVMEVGYSVRPNDPQSKGHHVVLRANRGKTLDDMPQQKILGPDHGWFRVGEFKPETGKGWGGDSWLDWYGNLEVTPPLPGKPFGRIFYGYNKYSGKSLNPQIVETLEAQGVQTPLIKIHTGWLLIKHVDEIFNFIRVKSAAKGFKVMVPDARLAYKLLEKWHEQGKGSLPVLKDIKKGETIASLLSKQELKDYNLKLQQSEVEVSIGMMKNAIGLDENDIIRIPVIFEKAYGFAGCLIPNMVNSIHMNGHQVIADPRGPIENGKDLLQEYVRQLLKKKGITAHFVDDLPYHVWGGNAHCATNVTYEPYAAPWWN
jgi:protein-arginine deiminase